MKKLIIAASLALAASAANAGTIGLPGGVSLDPITNTDLDVGQGNFNNTFNFVQWWDNSATADFADALTDLTVANSGDYHLNGIGKVVMGSGPLDFGMLSCNGCELTFQFGDIGLDLTDPSAPALDVSAAFLNVYLDNTPDLSINAVINDDGAIDASEVGLATDGNLWLSMSFAEVFFNPSNPADGVFGLSNADSYFSLAVNGGAAEDSFNTNAIRDLSNGLSMFADVVGLGLSATFNNNGASLYAQGTSGNFSGVAVSAPANVALLGLGIFGLAFAARRKAK